MSDFKSSAIEPTFLVEIRQVGWHPKDEEGPVQPAILVVLAARDEPPEDVDLASHSLALEEMIFQVVEAYQEKQRLLNQRLERMRRALGPN